MGRTLLYIYQRGGLFRIVLKHSSQTNGNWGNNRDIQPTAHEERKSSQCKCNSFNTIGRSTDIALVSYTVTNIVDRVVAIKHRYILGSSSYEHLSIAI